MLDSGTEAVPPIENGEGIAKARASFIGTYLQSTNHFGPDSRGSTHVQLALIGEGIGIGCQYVIDQIQ